MSNAITGFNHTFIKSDLCEAFHLPLKGVRQTTLHKQNEIRIFFPHTITDKAAVRKTVLRVMRRRKEKVKAVEVIASNYAFLVVFTLHPEQMPTQSATVAKLPKAPLTPSEKFIKEWKRSGKEMLHDTTPVIRRLRDAFTLLQGDGSFAVILDSRREVRIGGVICHQVGTLDESAPDVDYVTAYIAADVVGFMLDDPDHFEVRKPRTKHFNADYIVHHSNTAFKMNNVKVNGGYPIGVKFVDVQPGCVVEVKWTDSSANTRALVIEADRGIKTQGRAVRWDNFKIMYEVRRNRQGNPVFTNALIQQDQLVRVVSRANLADLFESLDD